MTASTILDSEISTTKYALGLSEAQLVGEIAKINAQIQDVLITEEGEVLVDELDRLTQDMNDRVNLLRSL